MLTIQPSKPTTDRPTTIPRNRLAPVGDPPTRSEALARLVEESEEPAPTVARPTSQPTPRLYSLD